MKNKQKKRAIWLSFFVIKGFKPLTKVLFRLPLVLARSRRGKASLLLQVLCPNKELVNSRGELSSTTYWLLVNSGYASIPHSPISTPSYSSSSDILMPNTILIINQTMNEATNTQTKIVAAPTN